ncbi:ATP-dependent RecD-like DNA helicase [Lentibacillus cibarius]|uniref:ATP-dependent RecD2 DNA helicase n=1 Tax=Lentibacillus cibarius TaxID=2583219 RepID=A0A549YLN2_9BACI|nr:ATP-dependent RecD-like DNA helicase [Lentibacillus cibarius]TRM08749.1 ATP-dependent RecD-like DNA helicase [Lentibacillus cibarius]TRM12793.1 ATP-dependent RecD-like DNA helicase [Lentibacillus cibarius]
MVPDKPSHNEQGFIKGELLYTIFRNAEEQFTIAKITVHETNEDYQEKEIVVKGYFSSLQESTAYLFYGTFERHAKFGLQYQVTSYQTFIPDTKDGLINYLSSDLFQGIGKKTAEKIVDHLGDNAITKILNNPDSLNEIPGLKKGKAELLSKTVKENQGFEHIAVYLSKYGIGLKMAQKIYRQYKEEALHVLQDDPYQFVFDIDGFGFQTADQIARQNGLSFTHPNRIGAGCIYVLQKNIQNGHVYLPIETCINQVLDILTETDEPLEKDFVTDRLEELNREKKLIMRDGNVYLPSLYYAEDGFASHVDRLMSKPVEHDIPLAELMKIIGDIEEQEAISYGKEQFEAIKQALNSRLMAVTGGPGTGKTTVIKGILNAYATVHNIALDPAAYDSNADYPFILAAPTGRAAKRLTESTGLPAVTIHRLLGWDGQTGFDKDEHEPLTGSYLIVDEFSMVDIWLANSLFKAIPDDMQVLLVGDEDQLPSVGPGQVLADLLGSERIPFVSLNDVYRQKEGSKIIELAHLIKQDACEPSDLKNDHDFSFIPCSESQLMDVIITVFNKAKTKGIDVKNIQVLAPMYRSQTGINMINKYLQRLVNPASPSKREVKANDVTYRVGDKVLQLVNQPEDGIFNGDIGEVVAIFEANENVDKTEQLVVSYDGKEVVYERKDYINMMHAYCISIHKSQGSEFPIVILPVVLAYRRMLKKNLLYTAITRSKKSLIICGEQEAFLRGVRTLDSNQRFTTLKEQLLKLKGHAEQKNMTDSSEEDITPYDFM